MPAEGGDGRYEGTIFGGLKFFVARQVPFRNSFVDKLKTNGAKVVQLEKFADVIIGDELRRAVIPNAVSYKFIDKCIAEGDLVDIDEFRLSKGNAARPVASALPTKGIRAKFTPADDQILVSWVRRYQQMGASIGGNEIYKELAKQYPNHPWQSWQARWIKTLSFKDEKGLPETTELPSPEEYAAVVHTLSVTQKSLPAPTQGTRARVPFTAEDDKLIFEYVQDRMRQGAKDRGNVIYQEFEEQHPHHTAHSWRDRYIKHLANRDPNSFYKQPSAPKPAPQLRQSRTAAPASNSLPTLAPPSRRPLVTQPPPKQPVSRGNRAKSSTPASSIPPGESRTERLKRITSAKKIQRAWSRYTLRRTIAQRHALRLQEHASLPEFPLLRVERDGEGVKFSYPTDDEDDAFMDSRPREPFPASEEAVRMFLRLAQRDIVEEFELEGKKVNLFELWRLVVKEHEVSNGMREVEWLKVAESLGLFTDVDDGVDEIDHEQVGRELRGAFRKYGLLEAWEAMGVFEERDWEGVQLGGSM
ncbi:Rap1 Myb domain-containing protein [Cladorrhinum sp. PSN332]|nr:Rap1 Myb domain-containing protein [Cladorrhinum sp. PSN332]